MSLLHEEASALYLQRDARKPLLPLPEESLLIAGLGYRAIKATLKARNNLIEWRRTYKIHPSRRSKNAASPRSSKLLSSQYQQAINRESKGVRGDALDRPPRLAPTAVEHSVDLGMTAFFSACATGLIIFGCILQFWQLLAMFRIITVSLFTHTWVV
jgi:hypothetical protein